jgi:hypothetical protein
LTGLEVAIPRQFVGGALYHPRCGYAEVIVESEHDFINVKATGQTDQFKYLEILPPD